MHPPPPDHTNVTLAVLAGGSGSRMGGPKAWLEVRGRPVLDYLLDRFAWPGPTLLVTAPGLEHPPGCERFAAEATDAVPGEGPLRGILTALRASRPSQNVIVTTVDMPRVGRAQFQWLLEVLNKHPPALGVLPVRQDGMRERVEPFPCVVSGTATPTISARLEAGIRSVHSLVPDVFMPAPVPGDWAGDVWANLNYPDDYQRFVRSL